jgi:hypothetical protein
MSRLGALGVALLGAALVAVRAEPASAQWLLVPMDREQSDHLRAYGLTYWVLDQGTDAEWLLNYRGGSFLLPDAPGVRREAALRGVSTLPMDPSAEARMRATIEASNMEAVPLERAPKVAVYTPPNSRIWDDAVTMALEYAGIPFETIWDPEVLGEGLSEYEWIHLHHEDFTGQYSKFFLSYGGAPWLQDEVARNEEMAASAGAPNVPELKKRVAEAMYAYVEAGGFLFAMCSATETLELALAAAGVDIAAQYADGDPPDADASARMDWERTMAFIGAEVQISPSVNAFSDIDAHQVNTPWRRELGAFSLFDFSAKFDPVPAMLTQNHVSVLPDFYGLTTSFSTERLKPAAIVLASEDGAAKYLHGNLGEGTWTYFGGHDPEDPEHQIGDPPTDLSLHPNSPGYRLILNNVLFPAARKQKLKT